MNQFQQLSHSVRLEWGPAAIRHLGPKADCIVIVDVMSFSTCVNLAVERGGIVYPYRRRDESAQRYGEERGAEVASGKRLAHGWSLSPQSMLRVTAGLKLVLPSPNGSRCTLLARDLGKPVYCASLRNLDATAAACRQYDSVLIVPCGECWADDNSLRPSFEDHLAAGGLVSALGRVRASPEARAAALVYEGFVPHRSQALAACGSALELTERGFAADVALCLEENVCRVACRLAGDCFVAEVPAR